MLSGSVDRSARLSLAIEHHHYSVPWRFARREVGARICRTHRRIFIIGERIAAHMRGSGQRRHTTIPEHMPSSHWLPLMERLKILEEAARIGPMLSLLVQKIIEDRAHPEQGYHSCLGIIGLEKRFSAKRLEAAARRALDVQARNYPSIKSTLEKGLDRILVRKAPEQTPIFHTHIRCPRHCH